MYVYGGAVPTICVTELSVVLNGSGKGVDGKVAARDGACLRALALQQ